MLNRSTCLQYENKQVVIGSQFQHEQSQHDTFCQPQNEQREIILSLRWCTYGYLQVSPSQKSVPLNVLKGKNGSLLYIMGLSLEDIGTWCQMGYWTLTDLSCLSKLFFFFTQPNRTAEGPSPCLHLVFFVLHMWFVSWWFVSWCRLKAAV